MVSQFLLIPLMILATPANSFTAPSRCGVAKRFATTNVPVAPLHASRADLATKEFQLEELEDKEDCQTELWLNDDGTVTLGMTNGPRVKDYSGSWSLLETASEAERPFRMRLTRSYEAGSSSSGENMMGDFTYDIKREYWGSIEMVGSSIAVAGKTHANLDNSGNAYIDEQSLFENEVGFFSMIDSATSEGIEGVKSSS